MLFDKNLAVSDTSFLHFPVVERASDIVYCLAPDEVPLLHAGVRLRYCRVRNWRRHLGNIIVQCVLEYHLKRSVLRCSDRR